MTRFWSSLAAFGEVVLFVLAIVLTPFVHIAIANVVGMTVAHLNRELFEITTLSFLPVTILAHGIWAIVVRTRHSDLQVRRQLWMIFCPFLFVGWKKRVTNRGLMLA